MQNTGLLTLLAPVLRRQDALGAAVSPRRVILIFSGNGPMMQTGPASGSESAFTLADWWKPLERHKADGIFLSHMVATGGGVVPGAGHGLGGQIFGGYGTGTGISGQYVNQGETIDQVIGKRLEAERRAGIKRSVVWGLAGGANGGEGFCAGPGRSIAPELDPSKAWAELFMNFMPPATDEAAKKRAAAQLARERSVLDFVSSDCKQLKDVLGAEGVRLLDDHCATLRSMELNLASVVAGGAASSCSRPPNPGPRDWPNPENIDAQMAAFIEIMAVALACELTHVVGFQFAGQGARNALAAKYGVPSSPKADSGDLGPRHHAWTHQANSPTKMEALRIFTTFYASQVALLVDKLKTTMDASGKPLLDSTLVVWVSELGGNDKNVDPHQTGMVPVVVFGRGQGLFKTGTYFRGKCPETTGFSCFGPSGPCAGAAYQEAGRDMARLLVSVVQYMGLTDVRTVGKTGVTGPLISLYR